MASYLPLPLSTARLSCGTLAREWRFGLPKLAGINSVAFSPDGKTIAASATSKKLIFWNIEGDELNIKAQEKGVESVAFSSDGRLMATSSEDKTVKLWNFN